MGIGSAVAKPVIKAGSELVEKAFKGIGKETMDKWGKAGVLPADLAPQVRHRLTNHLDTHKAVDAPEIEQMFKGMSAGDQQSFGAFGQFTQELEQFGKVTDDTNMLNDMQRAEIDKAVMNPDRASLEERVGVATSEQFDMRAKEIDLRNQEFRNSDEGVALLAKAYKQYAETGNLNGLTDTINQMVPRNKKGKHLVIDPKNPKGITLDSTWKRNYETLKRELTTTIPISKVRALAKKYKVDDKVVKEFLAEQKAGKAKLLKEIKRINTEVTEKMKANPELAKAIDEAERTSLGHIRAAKTFDDSADILSNIELENFFTNVQRGNKAELPIGYATVLNASKNLEEEFLKFIDPDLRKFWTSITAAQRKQLREFADSGMDVNEALQRIGFGQMDMTEGGKVSKFNSGILHSPTGTGDQAFDNVVRQLQENPNAFDTSGMGGSINISDRN